MKSGIDSSSLASASVRQLALGAIALLLGLAFYVLCRKSVPIVGVLPVSMSPIFADLGAAGGSVPTFLHTVAFCALSVGVLGVRGRAAAIVCASWAAVHMLVEIGQARPVYAFAASWLGHPDAPTSIAGLLDSYFRRGVFDVCDLLAALAGAALTYWFIGKTSGMTSRSQPREALS